MRPRRGRARAQSDTRGHEVAVIDQDPAAFRRLRPEFSGTQVKGVGFDREVLRRAGIADAYAFAAVSSGDNSNIIAARVARETFGVSRVVARIYDAARAEIYERLGIPTVATVRWAADQTLQHLLPSGSVPDYFDPSGHLVMAAVSVHPGWVGHRLSHLEREHGVRVAFVDRLGEAQLPGPDTVHQEGDVVHLLCARDALSTLQVRLDRPPPEELTGGRR